MRNIRSARWIVSAILLTLGVGVALAASGTALSLLSGPTATAQVGVPYSSAVTATGGNPPYGYVVASGALPPGLTLTSSTGAIAGTPTTAGAFGFAITLFDTPILPTSAPAETAAAKAGGKRTLAQTGNNGASITTSTLTITVTRGSAAGAPVSMWTLCLMVAGLAGVGLFRLRQTRRA